MRTINREGVQASEPPSVYGNVKVCTEPAIIQKVLGDDLYFKIYDEAAQAMEPECPEIALLYPALSFNLLERAAVSFYDGLTLGSLGEASTTDVRSWKRKLPEDDGAMFRATARLMKWS